MKQIRFAWSEVSSAHCCMVRGLHPIGVVLLYPLVLISLTGMFLAAMLSRPDGGRTGVVAWTECSHTEPPLGVDILVCFKSGHGSEVVLCRRTDDGAYYRAGSLSDYRLDYFRRRVRDPWLWAFMPSSP